MMPLPERVATRIAPNPSGCWEWVGARTGGTTGGYGSIRIEPGSGPRVGAHRLVYEILIGRVPDGRELDHLCRNRGCVNPDHLEPVTHRENLLRGETIIAIQAARTRCPQGHRYDYADRRGWRGCRRCRREHRRRFRDRNGR